MTDNVFSVLENPMHDVYVDLKMKLLSVEADKAGTSPPLSVSVVSPIQHPTTDDFTATLPTSAPSHLRYIYEREYVESIQLTKTLITRGVAGDGESIGHMYGIPSRGVIIHPLGRQLKIVIGEILKHNGINMGTVYRGACNLVVHAPNHPRPHVDHSFPHVGMLIYLNTCEGDTIICNEQEDFSTEPDSSGWVCERPIESVTTAARISPEEDKVIIMNGANYHYNMLPPEGAGGRSVIVATFSLR